MIKHENFSLFLTQIDPKSIFVEIGGDRFEGSTQYLAALAYQFGTELVSVDIDVKDDLDYMLGRPWKMFYRKVKDPSWPEEVRSIDDLPAHIRAECIERHQWPKALSDAQIYFDSLKNWTKVSNTQYICAKGSEWSQQYNGKPISLLYLDNFDYIWNIEQIPSIGMVMIDEYKNLFNLDMNNQNCQVEHLSQLIHLYPYLTPDCLVGFDDTYQHNGCWIGKSGAGVIYLLSKGWKIIHNKSRFVIMSRS